MPLWLKAVFGSLVGAFIGSALGFAGCAAFVMLNGGWMASGEKLIVGVLIYGSMAIIGLAFLGFILGLAFVLNRQTRPV